MTLSCRELLLLLPAIAFADSSPVIEKVNSPFLRALPDFGNVLVTHNEEYNALGVKTMLGHAWSDPIAGTQKLIRESLQYLS